MKEKIEAKTIKGSLFVLEVSESGGIEYEVSVIVNHPQLGQLKGYLRSKYIQAQGGYRGLMTSISVGNASLFLALNAEEEKRVEEWLVEIRHAENERKPYFVEVKHLLDPSEGNVITEKFDIRKVDEFLSNHPDWKDEVMDVVRKWSEQQERKERKEKRIAEAIEAAKKTGQPQLAYSFGVDCDGSVPDCSADIIEVWYQADGTSFKKRIHTF